MTRSKPKIKQIDNEVKQNRLDNKLAKTEADYSSASKALELLKTKSAEQKRKLDSQIADRSGKLNALRAEIKQAGTELAERQLLLAQTNKEIDDAVTSGNEQLRIVNFEYERIKKLVSDKETEMADYTNTNDKLHRSIVAKRSELNDLNLKYEQLNAKYQNILNGLKDRVQSEYAKYQTIVQNSKDVIERLKKKEQEIEEIKLRLMNS